MYTQHTLYHLHENDEENTNNNLTKNHLTPIGIEKTVNLLYIKRLVRVDTSIFFYLGVRMLSLLSFFFVVCFIHIFPV